MVVVEDAIFMKEVVEVVIVEEYVAVDDEVVVLAGV
jgi:hypothetical protein